MPVIPRRENWQGGKKPECCTPITNGEMYLGTTCPKCNKPFRNVIQKEEPDVYALLAEKCGLHETRVPGSYITKMGQYFQLTKYGFERMTWTN